MSTDESNSSAALEGREQNFFAEFLDDYFAESDAHMTNARRNLLALESYVESGAVELGLVEELLRSFHTLKGLSGMVGIREAEALAHEMESYLRTLREEKARLSSEGMDALIAGTQMLQQVIAARKEQAPPPNINAIVARIQAMLPPGEDNATQGQAKEPPVEAEVGQLVATRRPGDEETRTQRLRQEGDGETGRLGAKETGRWGDGEQRRLAPRQEVPPASSPPVPEALLPPRGRSADPSVRASIVLNNAEKEKLNQAIAKGKTLWHFEFAPNAELADKGINVNTIRTNLQQLGEIIHASPRMLPTGSIVFDFILLQTGAETQTDFDPGAKEIISASGLTYSPFEAPATPAATENQAIEPGDWGEGDFSTRGLLDGGTSGPGDQGTRGLLEQGTRGLLDQGTRRPWDQETREPDSPSPRLPVSPSPPLLCSPSPPPPPEEGAGEKTAPRESLSVMPANVVRVDLARLDELMQTLGELVISRARLEDRLKQLQETVSEKDLRPLKETNQQMERQLRSLRAGMLRVRLVPISDVFTRMQFVVRDLARTSGKRVKVELVGQDTEIDKFVVERLMDPLLHLVRNAVSHGLETPLEREAKGKSPFGKVVLRAATVGEMAVVEIEDDGKGIDAAEIIAKGREMGILSPEALDPGRKGATLDFDTRAILTGTLLLDILCTSGFSTRAEADLTSGRGVGLAVVRSSVQELGGSITLDSQVGVKTKFRIQLPLTLAIADALLATAGGQTFAIPLSSVREIIEVRPQDVTIIAKGITSLPRWDIGGAKHSAAAPWVKPRDSWRLAPSPDVARVEIIYHRGMVLPLLRLANFFNLSSPPRRSHHAFIIGFGDETNNLGIVVDRVIGQREIVVRPLTDALVNMPGISGATDLGDGRVVLILDASELIRFRVDAAVNRSTSSILK